MHWIDTDEGDAAPASNKMRGDLPQSTISISSNLGLAQSPRRRSIRHVSSMEIVLPPMPEEEGEETLSDQNSDENDRANAGDVQDQGDDDSAVGGYESMPKLHSASVLHRLRSGDSQSSYHELDDSRDLESQQTIHKSQPSRISWLFGGAQKKEASPRASTRGGGGENDSGVALTGMHPPENTHTVETESTGTPNKESAGRSRFSFLQTILQSHKEENGDFSQPDLSVGEFRQARGLKRVRQKPSNTTYVASTRATRIFRDGLGCAVGGVLLDVLLVKSVEFTLRFVEVKLREALPPVSMTFQLDAESNGRERTSDTLSGSGLDVANLVLDGADISRVKHVEIIVHLLKVPMREAIGMVQSWASRMVGTDIPDHWDAFVQENPATFERLVRERKLKLARKNQYGYSPVESAGKSVDSPQPTVDSLDMTRGSTISENSTDTATQKDLLVTALSLRYCNITARGIGILVDSLRLNQTLVSLNLCGNFINTAAAAASLGMPPAF